MGSRAGHRTRNDEGMSFEAAAAPPAVAPVGDDGVNPSSQWDPADYASVGAFVPAHGAFILQSLGVQPGERILDVGCGDGSLTVQLQEAGAQVVGLDASEALVAHARSRNLEVWHGDVLSMQFADEFDAIFSNAVLHWVLDGQGAARAMFRALRPGGRIALEFGGFGNIAAIRVALRVALGEAGYTTLPQDQFYPTARQYSAILLAAGFQNVTCEIVPRPTPLLAGLESWLRTFRGGLMNVLGIGVETRDRVFARTAELLAPSLLDPEGQWWADYVRIRAWAVKPELPSADEADPQSPPATQVVDRQFLQDPAAPPESDSDAALVAAPDAQGRWHVHEAAATDAVDSDQDPPPAFQADASADQAAPAQAAPAPSAGPDVLANPLSALPPPSGPPQQPHFRQPWPQPQPQPWRPPQPGPAPVPQPGPYRPPPSHQQAPGQVPPPAGWQPPLDPPPPPEPAAPPSDPTFPPPRR